MRRKVLWGLLALALAAPAVWAAGSAAASRCPIPCKECPFGR